MRIACDFDGTIVENGFPGIGEPIWETINCLKELQKYGAKLTLWTCREQEKLEDALSACADWGLYFDFVNENDPALTSLFGNDSRKVGANHYVDDKSLRPSELKELLLKIKEDL